MASVVILLLTSGIVRIWAQQAQTAEALIYDVADIARSAESWSAAGQMLTASPDGSERPPEQFRIAYHSAVTFRGRFEITTGEQRILRVCDGTAQWHYYSATNTYVKLLTNSIGPCAYPINAWPPLFNTMSSPRIVSIDKVTLEGRPHSCQVIRAPFLMTSSIRRNIELCVDPSTKTVLRFRMEELGPRPRVRTFTFSSLQRNPKLDDEVFQFHPPQGASEVGQISWLDPVAQPRDGVFRVSNGVTEPVLVSIATPQPSGIPSRSRGGRVVLYGEINDNGVPQNLKVIGSIGADEDREAIEAFKAWRFEPAIGEGGKPVPVVMVAAVNIDAR